MKTVRFSLAAQIDLIEIGDYIAKDNPRRAVSFVEEITIRCRKLGEFPRIGRSVQLFGPEMRILPVKGYIVVYRDREDGVTIERVWHGARDIISLLQTLEEN